MIVSPVLPWKGSDACPTWTPDVPDSVRNQHQCGVTIGEGAENPRPRILFLLLIKDFKFGAGR